MCRLEIPDVSNTMRLPRASGGFQAWCFSILIRSPGDTIEKWSYLWAERLDPRLLPERKACFRLSAQAADVVCNSSADVEPRMSTDESAVSCWCACQVSSPVDVATPRPDFLTSSSAMRRPAVSCGSMPAMPPLTSCSAVPQRNSPGAGSARGLHWLTQAPMP